MTWFLRLSLFLVSWPVLHRMLLLYAVLTICTTKLQMHPMQHNTLKSNPVSFSGSSVEKLNILLPLIFHPSFGLSVVLGTRRKAGGWGWSGVRETVKRLLNYSLLSVESAEWENCPRGEKRSRRSNRFMARMICFACLHSLKLPGSSINEIHLRKTKHSSMACTTSWDGRVKTAILFAKMFLLSVLFSVSVPKFPVSFCPIRNLTMFSMIKKTKNNNYESAIPIQLWCFSPSFSLKLHQLAHSTAFFILPWHLCYSESSLWNPWHQKKKKTITKKQTQKQLICVPTDVWQHKLPLCFEPV